MAHLLRDLTLRARYRIGSLLLGGRGLRAPLFAVFHSFVFIVPGVTRVMAKPTTVKIKLVSSADTGFFYVTKKNPRTQTEKLSFRKYDPVVRKHVDFKEAKIK